MTPARGDRVPNTGGAKWVVPGGNRGHAVEAESSPAGNDRLEALSAGRFARSRQRPRNEPSARQRGQPNLQRTTR
ncbi:MAG: hypothetical protein AVDCRST_MAG73-620 [uncultured Thermomicrobiales bacterium]|uniref:Uncharacterized protein n=1 Tax=uncultured Thermomicrobiales bacterium TaxID=1645740 RepID=A0A6J4TLT4_9BACT|nr:MAG: hypothetical protein AVDCRST_MAG73-620 [uncultured Thermomicrobiales bacterium]